MEYTERLADVPQPFVGIILDVGEVPVAAADDDEKRSTLDVPTKVWEVGVGLILDELRIWSFLTFTDLASPIPEMTSSPTGFRSPLVAWGMGGLS